MKTVVDQYMCTGNGLCSAPSATMKTDREELVSCGDQLSMDMVSALAGDRAMTESESVFFALLRESRGDEFFPDLLHAITHERFPSGVAEGLWDAILKHKFELSSALQRNVRVAVAALDYLSNLKGELASPTVISETHVAYITRMALRDGLTRLFNHTTCLEKIAVELRIYQRYGRPTSLLMVDVDDFKHVNDTYGHCVGDQVLVALGALIDESARSSDVCCRYGGEEFAVILPETDVVEAEAMAERIRAKVEKAAPAGRTVTLSIGVSACGEDTRTAQELVEKADAALYAAKRGGKNRVVTFSLATHALFTPEATMSSRPLHDAVQS